METPYSLEAPVRNVTAVEIRIDHNYMSVLDSDTRSVCGGPGEGS